MAAGRKNQENLKNMKESKCKICRRTGTKLFLRGERCSSGKCAIVKRPYAPGMKSKKTRRTVSEYGKELAEKQKLKNWYNLKEKQFAGYVKDVLEKRGKEADTGLTLIKKLESRLDSVIFNLGFTPSRAKAWQMVSHGHFLVNNKKVDIPSYKVKKGDKITIRPQSAKKAIFKNIPKQEDIPTWIKYSSQKGEAEIVGEPFLDESSLPAEIASVFEFYSR